MLEIKKIKNVHNYDEFYITTEEGTFIISYQNNLDLYWRYLPEKNMLDEADIHEFTITKENYYLYTLFEELYESIKNLESYPKSNIDNVTSINHSELFQNGFLEWYSDDFALIKNASSFTIKKIDDDFKVIIKKSQKEPESNMHFKTYSIRISNSGSRYKPFNSNFMKMYLDLKEYNPDYHQIHIEEYLYEQNKALTKKVNKV